MQHLNDQSSTTLLEGIKTAARLMRQHVEARDSDTPDPLTAIDLDGLLAMAQLAAATVQDRLG